MPTHEKERECSIKWYRLVYDTICPLIASSETKGPLDDYGYLVPLNEKSRSNSLRASELGPHDLRVDICRMRLQATYVAQTISFLQ